MLKILAHPDLPHEFVLVPVHSSQLTHMGKDILKAICQLGEKRVVLIAGFALLKSIDLLWGTEHHGIKWEF